LIYEGSPSRQAPGLAAVAAARLKSNYRCMFFGSAEMVAHVESSLTAAGIDVPAVVAQGKLILSSARQVFGDGLNPDAILKSVGKATNDALSDGYAGLWATGDVGWQFGPLKDACRLLDYEREVEQFYRDHPQFSGICQYHTSTLSPEAVRYGLLSHPTLFVSANLSLINPHYLSEERQVPGANEMIALDSVIRRIVRPVAQQIRVAYHSTTAAGEFQICEQNGDYFLAIRGNRIGKTVYLHPQFVIDDLVTGVIELPPFLARVARMLPQDLRSWRMGD
jgi:hypothetical protein